MQTEVKPIINKVAQRAIQTLDLADLLPKPDDVIGLDLKNFLFQELILREAVFRKQVEATNWNLYQNKWVVLHCSVAAIIPAWAYMVITAQLAGVATDVVCAAPDLAREVFFYRAIANLDATVYSGQRVVVKGCGDGALDASSFVYITQKLAPVVRALNYGEPCSMVPIFKQVNAS